MAGLERVILILTGRAGWVALIGLVGAIGCLQADGFIQFGPFDDTTQAVLFPLNTVVGLGFVVLWCLAMHAIFFRRIHRAALQASRLAPVPDRPWEARQATPITGSYLRSLRNSALVVGLVGLVLGLAVGLLDFGFVIGLAAWLMALVAEVWGRIHRRRQDGIVVPA